MLAEQRQVQGERELAEMSESRHFHFLSIILTCCCVSGGLFERLEEERGRHLEEVEKSKVKVDLFDKVDKVVWTRMNLLTQETKEWLNGGDGEVASVVVLQYHLWLLF